MNRPNHQRGRTRRRRLTLLPFSPMHANRIVSDFTMLGAPACPVCHGPLVIEGPDHDAWEFRCPFCRRQLVLHRLTLDSARVSVPCDARRAV